jgi:hypothetical protein
MLVVAVVVVVVVVSLSLPSPILANCCCLPSLPFTAIILVLLPTFSLIFLFLFFFPGLVFLQLHKDAHLLVVLSSVVVNLRANFLYHQQLPESSFLALIF